MTTAERLIQCLESSFRELSEAFLGMTDSELWVRPHPNLLSVGELASHICYWEAKSFLKELPPSPILVSESQYYPITLSSPYSTEMSANQVFEELKRIHSLCIAEIQRSPLGLDDQNPARPGWTWGYTLEYQAFHVAYHTGQIYSARHIFGHQTSDN